LIIKTVLLSPNCLLTDDELMLLNTTISNPTNRQIKQEKSLISLTESDEDEVFSNSSIIALKQSK